MLDPFSRGAIVAMSVLCIGGAVAFAPMSARSSSESGIVRRFTTASRPLVAAAHNDIDVQRDPFAAEPAPRPTGESTATASVATLGLPHGDVGPLPSNLRQSIIPAMPGDAPASAGEPVVTTGASAALRVTAIVTGAHPYAMLDTAGNHEIRGIGDRVDGKPIVAIDIAGVTLQGGERLTVSPGELSR